MRKDEAGKRVAAVEVRIPAGLNCGKCAARGPIMRRSEQYIGGRFEVRVEPAHRDICLLYGETLRSHSRRISGTRDPWGHNKTANVVEKCDTCLKGSTEYAVTTTRKGGADRE